MCVYIYIYIYIHFIVTHTHTHTHRHTHIRHRPLYEAFCGFMPDSSRKYNDPVIATGMSKLNNVLLERSHYVCILMQIFLFVPLKFLIMQVSHSAMHKILIF